MNIFEKITIVLLHPVHFFKKVKQEKGIRAAFLYFVLIALFGAIMGTFMQFVTRPITESLIKQFFGITIPAASFSIGMTIFFAFIGYLFLIAFSFVFTAIVYVWLLIFGGKQQYVKTYQLVVYSSTPYFLLSWIPFVSFFAWIYNVALLIIGTQEFYKFSRTKSILLYVIPLAVFIILMALVLVALILVIKQNPQLFAQAMNGQAAP